MEKELRETEAEGGGNVAGDVGSEGPGVDEDLGRLAVRDAHDLVVFGNDIRPHRRHWVFSWLCIQL